MVIERQLGNTYQRGPSTIDLPNTPYSADIYSKASYANEEVQKKLARTTERLIVKANLWTPEVARNMVTYGLAGSDPLNTSWIGFRKSDEPIGDYFGASWQEEIPIPTNEGMRRLLYMKLRVFEPDFQGQHLGRTAVQLSLTAHPEADTLAHRSGNPRAVRSWLESGVFRPRSRYPYDQSFDKAPEYQQVLLWIYRRFSIRGRTPNLNTGVSVGDYIEPNGSYQPDPNYPTTEEIRFWMEKCLKMKLNRGDSLYEIGEIK